MNSPGWSGALPRNPGQADQVSRPRRGRTRSASLASFRQWFNPFRGWAQRYPVTVGLAMLNPRLFKLVPCRDGLWCSNCKVRLRKQRTLPIKSFGKGANGFLMKVG